ncbi:DUF1206 domain-containing protein [Rhizobium sp. XQZ8]|uniref:DUF1206 domain-containing protein n=1 Tax=Rhizobium populisoli TaxID=2859785 RepID=UPI001C6810D6|nr:DUF1206 domain-containing protein [Rhizobium populisoli]MBW6424717.1 DUF1206 domain-containing protein [Rhizobium populisoli]
MNTERNLEWLARSGYAARGIVYILIAGMALLSTFGGGEPDQKSALKLVLEQPFGQVWLGLIGIGLIGFILWRIAQSVLNTDHHENNAKGYAVRAGLLVGAVTYTGLATYAIGQAFQLGFGNGSSDGQKSATAWLMQQPFGPYLVAAVGLCILGAAIAQVVKGVKRTYLKYFDANWGKGTLLDAICIYGLSARGAVFLIVGGFFLYAAFAVDPGQTGSTAEALAWVRQLPFGAVLYAAVALGLLAFGLYSFIEAKYRVINPPNVGGEARAIGARVSQAARRHI